MEMKKNLRKAVISFLAVSTAFSGALVTASLAAPDNNLITSVSAKEQGHITINANVGDNELLKVWRVKNLMFTRSFLLKIQLVWKVSITL